MGRLRATLEPKFTGAGNATETMDLTPGRLPGKSYFPNPASGPSTAHHLHHGPEKQFLGHHAKHRTPGRRKGGIFTGPAQNHSLLAARHPICTVCQVTRYLSPFPIRCFKYFKCLRVCAQGMTVCEVQMELHCVPCCAGQGEAYPLEIRLCGLSRGVAGLCPADEVEFGGSELQRD